MLTAFYTPVIICSLIFGGAHCDTFMTVKGTGKLYRSEDDCLKAMKDRKLIAGQRRACWRFDVEETP